MNPRAEQKVIRLGFPYGSGATVAASHYPASLIRLIALGFTTALLIGSACTEPITVPPSSFADTADQPPTVVGNRPLPPTIVVSGPGYDILIDGFEILILNHGPIAPGGTFPGGDRQAWNGQVNVHLVGTGSLAGWQRWIPLPINGIIDSAVRPYGLNVQSFDVSISQLQGQIVGDPDFDLLRVRSGSLNGLPSPGHTTLTRLPNNHWNLDSQYNVMYQIEYIGAPGGVLAGQSGNQIRQQHLQIGTPPVTGPPPVMLTFSSPLTNVPAQLHLDFTLSNNTQQVAFVPVNPGDTVTVKRDQTVAALNQAGATAVPSGPDSCSVGNLAPASIVRVTDLGTGEAPDRMARAGTSSAVISYPGPFDPFDAIGEPSIFNAGIVTDVGELSVQISAAELNFQTDGPIICQSLFQRLAPRAPDYGASINYAGDRLEVYFDPAYTVTQGGIIFGTTSPTPGNSGQLEQLPSGSGWTEQGDAPDLLPGQDSSGVDPMPSITGSITPMNDADLYCIHIIDPQQFEATTVGGASFDTQLFLFDQNGMGVTHNDDAPGGGTTQSRISGQFVPFPGYYLLAISSYNRDPLNPGGQLIWNNSPFNVERPPDGPGAPGPLSHWQGIASPTGTYTIQLSGCGFCTPTSPPIPPGQTLFATDLAPSIHFGGPEYAPIPADFFSPGSQPFHGVIRFGSKPYDRPVGNADTIVERMNPLELPTIGSTDIILARIVWIDLESVEPIVADGQEWKVQMSLSQPLPPSGTMTVSKTHATGGNWESTLPVRAMFTFTPTLGGLQRVYDPGTEIELDTSGSNTWSTIPPAFAQPGGGPEFFPDTSVELTSSGGIICRLEPAVADGFPVDCPALDTNRDNWINGLDVKGLVEAIVDGPSHPSYCAIDADANGVVDTNDIPLIVLSLLSWPMEPAMNGGWINIMADCDYRHHAVTECDNAPPIRTRRILVQAADKDGNPSNCNVKFRLYNCDDVPDGESRKVEPGDRECAVVDSNRKLEVWCTDGTNPCRISIKEVTGCPPP